MNRLKLGEVGVDGTSVFWAPLNRPHALLAGETGSGKTTLARSIIAEASSSSASVLVADGKGGGDFVDAAVESVALGPTETLDLLDHAADLVVERLDRNRSDGLRLNDAPPVLLVVDELAAIQLRRRSDAPKDVKERSDRIAGSLGEIALLGRAARVHLLVLLQRPDASALPGAIRDQLGLRVALGWMSGDGYRMMFGVSGIEPPRCLNPGNGWVSGYDGHRDGPRLLRVVDLGSVGGDSVVTRRGRWREAK